MNSTKPSLKNALIVEPIHSDTNTAHETEHLGRHHVLHKKIKTRIHTHVHKLRQRPDHHKRAIAFGVAFSVTAVVFGIWYFFSLPRIIGSYRINVEQSKRLNRSPNVIEGFNNLYNAKMNKASAVDAIEAGE